MAKKPKSQADEKYSDKEAKRRFEAALLGARLASAKPKKAAKKSKARKKPG